MKTRSMLVWLTFLGGAILPARANMLVAPPPLPVRVGRADLVVVGKAVRFADNLQAVPRFPGDLNPQQYQVAIVKVQKMVVGDRDLEEVRVGFVPPPPPPPPPAPGGPILLARPMPRFQLALNQEACLFLVKSPSADFYMGEDYYSLINKAGNPDWEKNLKEIIRSARLLENPQKGLTSENAEERLQTACLLISRYRMARPGKTKAVPIDAAESKLILETLARADWKQRPNQPFQMTPQTVFFQLGLMEKDGWKIPSDYTKLPETMQKWLEDHAGTYRIQRFVANTPEKETKKD